MPLKQRVSSYVDFCIPYQSLLETNHEMKSFFGTQVNMNLLLYY